MPAPRGLARFNRRVTNRIARHVAGWMPGMAIVQHEGRCSGTEFQTPVLLFWENGQPIIELVYGSGSDWVRNVLVAGECRLRTRGRTVRCTNPRLEIARSHPWAPSAARLILRLVNVAEVLRLRCG